MADVPEIPTKEQLKDKIVGFIVDTLQIKPDGSHGVCVYSCKGKVGASGPKCCLCCPVHPMDSPRLHAARANSAAE